MTALCFPLPTMSFHSCIQSVTSNLEHPTNCCFQMSIAAAIMRPWALGDTSRLTQSNQNENKQSEAAHSHYTISPPDPHFSLKHFLMTEQTNPNISNCLAFGGGGWVGWGWGGSRLVIISCSCYYMSGLGEGGVGTRGADEGGREKGVSGLSLKT